MRILVLFFTLLMLSSCSFFKEKVEEPERLTKVSENIKVKERWKKTVGKGLGELYQVVQPVINIDTVFANDIQGRIYAFDRQTGAEKWETHLKVSLSAGVGLGTTLVLVGSLDGDVIALNQLDGQEVWRTNIASEILAPPQTNDQIVVVQTNEGKLYGLDIATGKFLWRYTAKLPLLTLRGTATPQLFGNNLITGFANGKIAALSAKDGVLYWERRVAYPQGLTQLDRVVDVDGSPVVSGQTVYATSYNGHLTAIAPDGRLRWTQKVSSYQSPLVLDGRVFVTAADGTLFAYDAATGLPLWQNNLLLYRKLSAPQELSGFVVVSDYKGYIHVFDPELGVIIGRGRFDKDGIRSPMVSDGTYLYALGNDGELSSVSVHLRGTREQIKAQIAKEKEEEDRIRGLPSNTP
jgi:outer membrane protein assembly factor BamB